MSRRASDAPRARDAARSRTAILDAAERLFAQRGYDGVSLADIGEAAGLSRAAPAYFFGAKEGLHAAVMQRLFRDRTEALEPAFAPLAGWARADGPTGPLEPLLAQAVDGYLAFLHARPAFVRLLEREALDDGRRLGAVPHDSPVMSDALRALREARGRRGLRPFDPDQVLIAVLALCVFPLVHRGTLLRTLGLDADDAGFRRAHRDQVLQVLRDAVLEPGDEGG